MSSVKGDESRTRTAIEELEALAVLIAALTFRNYLEGYCAVIFSDNEAVRGAFLKSWSQNQGCSSILPKPFEMEDSMQSQL